MIYVWFFGFMLAVIAGCMVHERVKNDPYSEFAIIFIALCGFGVFPLINILVSIVAFIYLSKSNNGKGPQ